MGEKIKKWWQNNIVTGIAIIVGATLIISVFSSFVVFEKIVAAQGEAISTLKKEMELKADYTSVNTIIVRNDKDHHDIMENQSVISRNQILIYQKLGEITGSFEQMNLYQGAKKVKVKY